MEKLGWIIRTKPGSGYGGISDYVIVIVDQRDKRTLTSVEIIKMYFGDALIETTDRANANIAQGGKMIIEIDYNKARTKKLKRERKKLVDELNKHQAEDTKIEARLHGIAVELKRLQG